MLIELMMIDASREMAEARRFRARIIALTLAESGAELAACQMIALPGATVNDEDAQGSISGQMNKVGNKFVIVGEGHSTGAEATSAYLRLEGRIDTDGRIVIEFSRHTQ